MKRLLAASFTAAVVAFASGCASRAVVADATKLGSVVVYRNGVAYFERYADKGDQALSLRVPAERVDDFLKSLSIVDEDNGKALPVSYPTMSSADGYVAMTITLPPHTGRLRITYVTESPAWKPSYRVVLSNDDGKSRLQGWAVIDNVSGENWNKVKVGVGSTSALSFRFDLHSVRIVERELLGGGGELAMAPPTGGSPYATSEKKVRILGQMSAGELSSMEQNRRTLETGRAGLDAPTTMAMRKQDAAEKPKEEPPAQQAYGGAANVDRLAQDIKSGAHRVRIEGYAQSGDGNAQQASLDRANSLKNELVNRGIRAEQIDVVGTGRYSANAVSVLASDEPVAPTEVKEGERAVAPRDTQPVGQAYFVTDKPMTIAADHSAMVSILNQGTDARRVFFYDPVSDRGSKTFAFNAVRVANPTEYTLDGGPFTVYADGQFLGEGLSEPILPRAVAFIPYALDRSVVVDTAEDAREEIDRLLTVERGIASAETRRIRRTRLTLSNRGQEAAEVYVRHQTAPGFTLDLAEGVKLERMGGASLFPVTVAAGQAVELVIEEHTPLMKTVDIRTPVGVRDVSLFLTKKNVEPELKKKLSEVIELHTNAQNLDEKIRGAQEQLGVFRTRVDELTNQLASLRKVPQSEKLRQSLQTRMQEISDKLQKGTLDVTDLEGQLMTVRIALADKLADLTLERAEKPVASVR